MSGVADSTSEQKAHERPDDAMPESLVGDAAPLPRDRLYFFWDYDLSERDVRRIVREGNLAEKAWVISRILEYAKWDDIWRWLSLADIRRNFERLSFRRAQDRELWAYALERWTHNAT
jgi:hypothetical protein